MDIKRALISVSDKTGLKELVESLATNGVEIISSGGTAAYLQEHGYEIQSVESITDFPEMLSGRVKTLHPKIHGGILYLRNNEKHEQEVETHEIKPIDLVVVNLYPFEKTIAKDGVTLAEAIEQIDIGGPSLLRSASKNYQSVIVLSSASQYEQFIDDYKARSLTVDKSLKYAQEAFKRTYLYDQAIHKYFEGLEIPNVSSEVTSDQEIRLKLKQKLRYGENPHQKASLFIANNKVDFSGNNILASIEQLSGKELSYNNWLDIESAWSLINEFESEVPACAIIKHNTPCGVAIGDTLEEAYDFALESDPISAFGGIVALNSEVNLQTAQKISQIFLEVIIAPSFSEESLTVLKQKKNLRLVKAPLLIKNDSFKQYKSILGNGFLVQDFDNELLNSDNMKVVTKEHPSKEDWLQLLFAFRVCKHVRSNAIVIVNGNRTVGICGGQTNRVNSVKIALEEASDLATNAILASDGFFPFADNVDLAAQGRIKAIIQPGGSIRDEEVIEAANKYKIPMVFTNMRHFKH
ncbi:MAG: bifunctional phosphoribosylaminoimidazolecarboxamide formyltransferase/IMP cyclohydrolase [Candidatus Caenarcaniphilales bacterium]|nr:bifunctional phosphoribosylaminoimidazolecarboxamide formyltransferase/IMP cyclohydrolase [Candidatus Caenarcaniphilales bacterium]